LSGDVKPPTLPLGPYNAYNGLYCSTYAHAALKFGGYDMGFLSGITPKMLMMTAISKAINEKDKNIEVSSEAIDWCNREIEEMIERMNNDWD
jgi:hypothetical protein